MGERRLTARNTRRALLAGAGAVAAGGALAGCGTGADRVALPDVDPTGDGALATPGEVAVGGGVVVVAAQVVITQPAEGDFRGFSAICTHQGCLVSHVNNGTINCACHGSQFSIEDGSVVRSAPELTPQTQDPLPPVEITVDGDAIRRGG